MMSEKVFPNQLKLHMCSTHSNQSIILNGLDCFVWILRRKREVGKKVLYGREVIKENGFDFDI